MAGDFTLVRVRRATKERLMKVAAEIVAAVDAGRMKDPGIAAESINPLCPGLSVDALINLLLDQRDAHHERSRRSAAKKKLTRHLDTMDAIIDAALGEDPKG